MDRRRRNRKETTIADTLKRAVSSMNTSAVFGIWKRLPILHRRVLIVLVPVMVILWLLPVSTPVDESIAEDNPEVVRTEVSVNTTGLSDQGTTELSAPKTAAWHDYVVQSGDTLAKVFRTNQLPLADLNRLIAIEGLDKPLSKIKQGQLIRFKLDESGKLDILQLEKQGKAVMFFRLSDGGFGRSK